MGAINSRQDEVWTAYQEKLMTHSF